MTYVSEMRDLVTFLAGRVTGTATPDGEEGSELGWFSPDQLPALSGYNGLLTARARAARHIGSGSGDA
ncbi:NUDIX hydrolase [Paractinoplanes durhamensis]|uniref:Uncharacterized protein n=1 Tax=Paractinoplanes durhamensis TaxID=113563 RepID=A0ABQ3ZAV4_9ACTN|nr:hypothetical protein [Actinoplanes durhamensis]GIE06942.1 hypothetical protein Adu01nite_82920 [Actinoplanes durhamensis]